MVGVFDADDNLWLNATASGSSRKAATIKSRSASRPRSSRTSAAGVGKSGEYADYEYWNDSAKGSFWEFYDQPDKNPLLDNLKTMVKNHRPEEWQGKSWQAFRAMLKANPQGVHILTAGGLSRKNFLAGLKYLKEQGFLDELPPEENIQCVGNPEHPFTPPPTARPKPSS